MKRENDPNRSWSIRNFTIELKVKYREFLDWFDKEYPEIKRKDSIDGWIELELKNFILYQVFLRISSIPGGIKVAVKEHHPGLNPWSPRFREKAIRYFGELSSTNNSLLEAVWSDFPIEFEVLCHAAEKCLKGYCAGWIDPRLEVLPDGRIEFLLSQDELGNVGSMILSKRPKGRSGIEFYRRLSEDREPTQQEIMALPPMDTGKKRIDAYLDLQKRISNEKEETDKKIREHLNAAIDVFFRRLKDEGLILNPKKESPDAVIQSSNPRERTMNNVLLLTVTPVEAKAVLEVFPAAKLVPIGPKTYHDLGELGGVHLHMVQSEMGAGSPGASQSTVTHAIEALHPSCIIMAGIAFGLKPDNQRLGDVLISTQIRPYDLRKTTEKGDILRGPRPDAAPWLVDRFRAANHSWDKTNVHFGLLLCGQVKINDPAFRDQLREWEPDSIGGEMEGGGLYTAALERKTDWIIVKAICDWADGKNRDEDQPPAARNAVDFVLHVIRQGGLAAADRVWEEVVGVPAIAVPTKGSVISGGLQRSVPLGDMYQNITTNLTQALHQLPSPPRDFTGREGDLTELREAIKKGGATIGLRGMSGVGKTALALMLANDLKDQYPDAQFFMDLKGTDPNPVTPAQAMLHIIHGYFSDYQPSGGESELRGMYCSVLEGRRALLLLDNARDSRQVEPLLPPNTCVLILTSQEHILLPGLLAKDLACLSIDDAKQLLLKIAPRIGDAACEIASLCGDLPLALRLAAGALVERPDLTPQEYTSRLRDAKNRLALVDASLSISYNFLGPEKQKLWRMLAVFPDAFLFHAAAEVWEMEPERARDMLAEFFRFSLVEFDDRRARHRLHDLARIFAESRLSDAERLESQQRHAKHFVDVLGFTDQLYLKGGDSILQGLSVFDAEWKHIQAAQEWASYNTEINPVAATICVGYAYAGFYCISLRQNPRDRIRWLEYAKSTAKRIGDKRGEGNALCGIGNAYSALGEARRAIEIHEQALQIAREIGDRREEGTALGNLGIAYSDLGESPRAIEFYEKHLEITREIGDRRGEGNTLGNLGLVYTNLGEARRAIEFYGQALQIINEIGDRMGEGAINSNLGSAYVALGEPRHGIKFHELALQIAREIGDRRGEGVTNGNLGIAYSVLGEPRRAIEYYEQALQIAREIGDRRGEGAINGNLGSIYVDLGESHRGIEFFEKDLKIACEIGNRRGEKNALGNLGNAYAALGEPSRAIELYGQALQIAREIGDRKGEGASLGNLGNTSTALGETSRAIKFYEQALQIAREIGDRGGEALTNWNLGILYRKEGDLDKAISSMQKRVDYEREIGHSDAEKHASIVANLKPQKKNAEKRNRHKRHTN